MTVNMYSQFRIEPLSWDLANLIRSGFILDVTPNFPDAIPMYERINEELAYGYRLLFRFLLLLVSNDIGKFLNDISALRSRSVSETLEYFTRPS